MLPLKATAYCVYEQGVYRCYHNSYYGVELVLIPMFLFIIVFSVICLFAVPETNGTRYMYYTPANNRPDTYTP